VSRMIDCQTFAGYLDEFSQGKLSREQVEQLRAHALQCRECAMLFKIREHLRQPTIAELSNAMPPGMGAEMWRRVAHALGRGGPPGMIRDRERRRWWARPLLVPALTAACLLLLVVSTVLVGEIRRGHRREQTLAGILVRQEAHRSHDVTRSQAATAVFGIAESRLETGRTPLFSRDWQRVLRDRDALRWEELVRHLERLPEDLTLLDSHDAEELLTQLDRWRGIAIPPGAWGLDLRDGLQREEVIEIVRSLPIDPQRPIASHEIRRLFRGFGRGYDL